MVLLESGSCPYCKAALRNSGSLSGGIAPAAFGARPAKPSPVNGSGVSSTRCLLERSLSGAVRAADAASQIIGLLVAAEFLDRWWLRNAVEPAEVRALTWSL